MQIESLSQRPVKLSEEMYSQAIKKLMFLASSFVLLSVIVIMY